jgi:hypothetical protein
VAGAAARDLEDATVGVEPERLAEQADLLGRRRVLDLVPRLGTAWNQAYAAAYAEP